MRHPFKTIGMTAALAAALTLPGIGAAQNGEVVVGIQSTYNPWKVAISDGEFEKRTGYDITWRQFDSGSRVITALASGAVDIAVAGSSPIAAAISRDVDMKLFWITMGIASGEALVVRNGSGIEKPEDIKGKTIAVPFVSTTHYHMMFALEHWGIDPSELRLLNMQPNQAAAAWERGDIDGAFVWNPALGRMLESGSVLITSGDLCELGKCTFDGMVVQPGFAEANPEFMVEFVRTVAEADANYRDNIDAWTPDSEPVQKIVGLVGGDANDVPGVLKQYIFPTLEEQASAEWLGGGADTGAAFALADTAAFLQAQGKVESVPEDITQFVTDRWVKAAMQAD